MTRQELLNKIAVLLGGRASEEIHFGDVSTGAHNDLAKATDIARSMIKEYGMSSGLGQVYFEKDRKQTFLESVTQPTKDYSEDTARIIDQEVKAILDSQYSVARDVLTKLKKVVDQGAQVLLKEENIEGARLKAMLETP